MDNIQKNAPKGELNDDALDAVSGGINRPLSFAPCKRCGARVSEKSLMGGYCRKCLEELDKMGVHPVL